MIDDNGNVIQLSGDGVKISYIRNSGTHEIDSFTIIGPDGTMYIFNVKEIATHKSHNGVSLNIRDEWSACTAWYVSDITSANRLETATFTYKDGYAWKKHKYTHRQTKTVGKTLGSSEGSNLHPMVDTFEDLYIGWGREETIPQGNNSTVTSYTGSMSEETATKLIDSITLNGDAVIFSYAESTSTQTYHHGRDIYNYPAQLRRLTINSSGHILKSYDFQTEMETHDGRVILSGIRQNNSSGREDDYWKFAYNTLNETVSSLEQDWYGYYNGVYNNSGNGNCPFTYKTGGNYSSDSGRPDAEKAKYMSLKSINHNGACTEIECEGSSFSSNRPDICIGVRVKQIKVKDSASDAVSGYKVHSYTYENAKPNGVPEPYQNMYIRSTSSGSPQGSMTWSFTLYEDPVIFGPSIKDTRVYYGKVSEKISHPAIQELNYAKTVRYFDTSELGRYGDSVFDRCPTSVLAAYNEYRRYTSELLIDGGQYVGLCQDYMDVGPGGDAPLIKKEEYAIDDNGSEKLVSSEEYTYSTPSRREILVAYAADNAWSSTGGFSYNSMYHYPIYANTYSGRVPISQTTTLFHDNGSTTKTVKYTYKDKSTNFETPFRLSSTTFKEGKLTHKVDYKYADDLVGDAEMLSFAGSLKSAHVLTPVLKTLYYIDGLQITDTHNVGSGDIATRPYPRDTSLMYLDPNPSIDSELGFWKKETVTYDNYIVGSKTALLPSSHKEYTNGNLSWTETVLARDCKGNISDVKQKGKPETVLIWGYAGRYPVAIIENSTISEVTSLLAGMGVLVKAITEAPILDETMSNALEALRTLLPDALVKTCLYKVGVGLIKMTDENGMVTQYDYDASGRLVAIKDAEGHPMVGYEYNLLTDDYSPKPLSIRNKTYLSENGTSFRETVSWWSTLGLKLQDIAIGASGSGKDLVTAHGSDLLFHDDVKVWLPYPIENTAGEYQQNAAAQSVSYHANNLAFASKTYEMSRLDKVLSTAQPGYSGKHECTYSNSSVSSFPNYIWISGKIITRGNYSNTEIVKETVVNEDGKETNTFKDHLGRIIAESVGPDDSAFYIYDDYCQLRAIVGSGIALTDTLNMWRFDYDTLGRMSAKAGPGCAKEFYIYDNEDRVVEIHRPYDIIENEYNDLGQLVRVYRKSLDGTNRVLLEENQYSGILKTWSKLAEFEGDNPISSYSTIMYQYDGKGRLIRSITAFSYEASLTVDFEYNFIGDLLKKESTCALPDGSSLSLIQTYTYDSMSRPTKCTNVLYENGEEKSQADFDYVYDELGRLEKVESTELNSAVKLLDVKQEYDLRGRIVQKSTIRRNPQATPGSNLSKFEFGESLTYSPGGLITGIIENGTAKEYAYDDKGRLVRESMDEDYIVRDYTYDARGNILSDGRKQFVYEGDRLKECQSASGTQTYVHDLMGRMIYNITSGEGISYNSMNLPAKITMGSGNYVEYSYLADGTKTSSLNRDWSGLLYIGPFVFKRGSTGGPVFESALISACRMWISEQGTTHRTFTAGWFLTLALLKLRPSVRMPTAIMIR